MKLKQFIFALVAMLSSFAFTANAQQLLVNCDYNSSTEGWGTTKFSNYAGAYAYATANSKTSATIVIEKTNTISGNTFDNNHKNYSRLAVVIKDGATMGNAASKWDMTYPVTVEPGGTLTCARPASASVSNIHIKNKLIVGAKGATKKAYVNFLSDSYQDCDISIRYNGSIEVYNADFYVQDLDAQGKLTIEDSKVEVDGAFASATFFATTLTNTEMVVNGNQISGGLSDFAGGTSNQLGNVKLNNSTLTIKEGDTKVAANVTATNSTINVDNLTVNSGKTLNLNEGSTLEAANITTAGTGSVKIDGVQAEISGGQAFIPVAKIGEQGYETLAAALEATKTMTGDVTVEILDKVTFNQPLIGNYTSINFVGKDTDAEMYLDVQGYTTATGKKVSFTDLKLSKSEGGFIANAGFMNVAFGIYDVEEVTYTNCTFENGACASSGKVTFNGCTFYRSHDRYGLWAYGAPNVVVDGCTFADIRGIKLWDEGKQKLGALTVKNTDFSAVDGKPAIVLTSGKSVTLAGNTYNTAKGALELDLDGNPNGTPVTSDVTPVCVNDNGACGVLVDGKIYTTVAQAAEVASSGSTVTLLHNSAETVELAEGVVLDKNGFEAAGVTVYVKPTVAKIGDTPYYSLAEALEDAKTKNLSEVVITIIGENTAATADKFNLYQASVFNKVTFKQENGNKPYYFEELYTGSRTDNGQFVFDGVNLVVTGQGQYIFEGNVVLSKNSLIKSTAEANCFVYNAEVTVEAGSKIDGVIEDIRGGSLIIDGGKTDGTYCEEPGLRDAILVVNWVNSNLVLRNGAYVNINAANEIGRLTVNGTLDVANSKLESYQWIQVNENGTMKLKAGSDITTNELKGNGNITIDATDMAAGDVVLTATTVNFTGTLSVINNDKLEAKIVDGKIVLAAKPVAKIGEQKYATLQEAFKAATSGCIIDILSDVTVDYNWDARNTGAKFTVPVTINGNGKTIKFTGSVNDNNWNTVFRFEENAAVNNLTVDISSATGAQRVISAKKSLNVDGLTIVGAARYGVIYGEGASATDLAATEIVVKNSTLGGTRRALSDNEGGKDVKSVVIESNTFNANVYVSASESIAFNNNTVTGETDLRSYAADNVLNVQAKDNTLATDKKNYIYAKTIEAQTEFATKNPPLKVATKAELQAALAAAKEGDVIILTADIDYGTDQLAIAKAITLDLGGKTLTTRNAFGGMSIKGNPTVKNGNIVHASNTAAIKVWNATAFENLVIDVQGKGDANKTIGGIVLQSGSTTRVGSIKNVTIKGAALTNGIETYNCGDATENVIGAMENVTIDAQGTGLLISAPCGTATNCDIKGGVNAVEIFIKGNYSASLELVASTVEGGVYAHDEFSSNPDIVNSGTIKFTADEATTGADAEDVTLTIARAETEKVQGVLKEVMDNAVAKLNNTYYATLQAAVDAVKNGETITLTANVTGNVTLTEKVGLHYTIDGNSKQFDGTISVKSLSDTNDNRRITIKNIKFVDTADANVDFISSVNTNHYPRLTIEGCTFTGSGNDGDVAVRLKSSHSVVIKDCTATGLHSFIQNTSGWNLTIENVTVTDSKSGLALGTVQGVTVKGCEIAAAGYGIRMDAQYNNNAVIESNTIKAFIPVVVRKAEVNSNITVQGTNTFEATNTDGLWMAVGTSEYETNGEMPTAATAEVKVVLTDTGLDAAGIYGSYYDALTIHVGAAQKSRMVTRDIYVATMDEAVAQAKAINTGAVIYKVYGEVELTTGGSHGILDLGENVVIEGADATAKLTIVGGGVPDIKGVTFRNITLADEGTYLPTANEFMYQNYIDCTFENVTFVDGIRLSGTSTIKDSKVDANTTNEYAIWLDEGEFTMTGTTVVGGADAYGLVKSDAVSKITITGNTFQYLGEANKEALNVKEAVVIAENNQFIDCVKGILPADKTNYTDESKTTVATDAAIAGNNTVTVYYAAVGEQKFETLLEAINAVQQGETITLLRDVTMDYNARDAYETQAQNVVIDGNGKVLTLNQKNSDWASFGLANNSKLVLNNMTIEKTGYGDTSGAWNTHAIIFSCPVEMNGVTVNNSVAVQAGAVLNDVTINEANGYYGLWINGNGQAVTVNGGAINATNGGRGIKIADQYIDAPAQVTLNVTGTAFNTAKKAAVLVSSTAGAQIAAANVNIANVAEDNVNLVWVDEDWAQHFGNIEVTGATVRAEGVAAFTAAITANGAVQAYYKTLAKAINAAKAGDTITLLQDVKENVTISKNLTIDGADNTITGMITTDGKGLKITVKNVKFDGNNKSINYAMRADDNNKLVVENCTVNNYIYGFLYANKSNDKVVVKNVTVENCAEYGAYLVSVNSASFENFTVNGNTKYGIAVANAGARTVNLKNVTFENAETPLHIKENGAGEVTFNFSGSNEMSKAEFYTSQYVKVVAAAQVGTKVCGSLQDAVVAANNGETVKVLADVNMTTANFVTQVDGYATLVNVAGKAVTIDLNGKKVTVNAANADLNGKAKGNMLMSVFHADPNGTLTLTDSSAEGTGTVELFANDATVYGLIVSENTYDKSNPGKIIVNGGNYIADRLSDSMIFADINEVIIVNGGNFHLGNVGSSGVNGKPWIFNASGNNQIHINVNGGTYNADVAKQYWNYEVNLGEGLTTTNNGDGTWTVVPAVATVGNVGFGSIQEAINAAQEGETVKLVKDVVYNDNDVFVGSMGKTLVEVAGKNIVLDMNGKNIDVTYTGPNYLLSVIHVADGAGLTVTGEGSIDVKGLNADGAAAKNIAYVFYKSGTTGYLTIENGTFHMNDAADSMVYTNGDEIVTINGGTFILDAVASQTNGFPVIFSTQGNNERQIVVNAGTFNYDINHQIRPFEPYVAPEKALKKVVIDGRDMWTIVPAQAYVTEMLGGWVNEPGEYAHKVGYATVADAIKATNELGNTVTILAGEYTGNLNVNKGITVQGEVDAEGNNLVTFNGKLNITADGATVKNININNPAGSAAYVGAKDVVVDGCQVVGNNGFRSCYTSGTVTFKNSTITGATYGIHFDGNAGGNIVIENCTITGWTSFAKTIENVAISGTTFAEGNYNKLRLYQNATITDCTFNEKMTVDFGTNNTTAAFYNCTVENGKALTDVIYIADIAEMGIVVTVDGLPVSVVAKVGEQYYLSLQAAIDAATEGQTVTIISDIALTEGVTVAADDNIFIDLNGKTITGTPAEAKAFATITNRGTLTIQGNGAVVTDHQLAGSTGYAVNTITNCGTLTIDGATIENKSTAAAQIGYAIDNNSTTADAEVTVVSGTVTVSGSNYYDGIRQFCNSTTAKNDVIVSGGEVSSIWMQNPSDGADKNTKDVKGSVTIEGGNVGALYLEPSANFVAAITAGHVGKVEYFQTADGRDLKEFVTGGTFGTLISENFLAWGYQLTGDTAPYTVEATGRREVVTFVDGEFTEYTNENDIEVGTLTYKRTVGTTWTPLYVPFEIPAEMLLSAGFEVGYITGVREADKDNDGEIDDLAMEIIQIKNTSAILKANHPYFIRSIDERKALEVILENAVLHKSDEKTYDCCTMYTEYLITGNYSRRAGFTENDYGISAGNWEPFVDEYEELNPFRFYLTISPRENSPYDVLAVKSMSVVVRGEENEDGTTVIYDVLADRDIDGTIYDLQGRKVVEITEPGIYIINGKKVFIK